MPNIIVLIVVTFIVTLIGGGGAYLLWLKTRPKKIFWVAKCYQVGEGVKPLKVKNGKPISGFKLNDLKPYIKDTLERVEQAHGIVIYKLQRLNMTTNAVTADMVDVWGDRYKEVNVLIQGDTATLLKKGYDKGAGAVIFQPMPRERIELIKSEIQIKKDRLRKEKDVLQAITPWIVAGICMLGLISIVYFIGDAQVKSAEHYSKAEELSSAKQVEAAKIYREALKSLGGVAPLPVPVESLGRQETQPPPSVE